MVNTKYEIIDKKATSFGGLHAISELINHINLDEIFVKHFGKLRKTRKYNPIDTLKLLISMILAVGERITDIYRLRNTPVIHLLMLYERNYTFAIKAYLLF